MSVRHCFILNFSNVPVGKGSMLQEKEQPLQADEEAIVCYLKWFNTAKGFGFVVPENATYDVFIHASVLQKGGHPLIGKGALLSCHIEKGDNGYSVIDVVEVLKTGECVFATDAASAEGAEEQSIRGIVKWYDEEKEFGFVIPDDGVKDIFIHKTCLAESGIEELIPGQIVVVNYKPVLKGREAVSIKLLENP